MKIEIKAEEMTEERPRKRQRSSSLEQQSNTNGHKTAAPAAAPPPLIPLEPSFFRVSPNDEFTREVGQWILAWSTDRQNVEIEAKLGILLDTRNHHAPVPSRLYFPVATECIITDPSLCHFESNMTVAQHAGYNALLNASVEDSASPSYIGARIKYSHTKEIDYFHSMPNGGKCRVTMNVNKDQTITPKPGGIVEKERIANMNVYSPKQLFDFRISVSTERPGMFDISFKCALAIFADSLISSRCATNFPRQERTLQRSRLVQTSNLASRFDKGRIQRSKRASSCTSFLRIGSRGIRYAYPDERSGQGEKRGSKHLL